MAAYELGWLSLGIQGVGAGMGIVGSFYSADSKRRALESEAEISEINARISDRAADNELAIGERRRAAAGLKYRSVLSEQRVDAGAGNVVANKGTAAIVRASTEFIAEDAMNEITVNAMKSALGYKTEASNQRIKAMSARGSASSINAFETAFTTGANQVARLSSSYADLARSGVLTKPTEKKVDAPTLGSNSFNRAADYSLASGGRQPGLGFRIPFMD